MKKATLLICEKSTFFCKAENQINQFLSYGGSQP